MSPKLFDHRFGRPTWARLVACCALSCTTWAAVGCGRTVSKDDQGVAGSGPLDPIPPDNFEDCPVPSLGPTPLRRLSHFELNHSLQDLFAGVPAMSELPQLPQGPYYDDPLQEITSATTEHHHALAHEIALKVSQDAASLQALTGCDPATAGEMACLSQFLGDFLPRAYRRPVNSEELAAVTEVFGDGVRVGGDHASGVRAVLEVVLQSPDFLYLVEEGEQVRGTPSGLVALKSRETASRLSYFLAGSAPDAELMQAADQDTLREVSQIEAHARRLLAAPRAREVVRHFYTRLLKLDHVTLSVVPDQPTFTEEVAQLTLQETHHFIDDVTFDGAGSFRALLTEPSTWVNGPLASFYGLPGVTGQAFQKVGLEPSRRAGLLTQASFLRVTSPGRDTRPVLRGHAVLKNLLCVDLPLPPPDVVVLPPADSASPNATTRQRLEAVTSSAACADCHRDLDPVGFAFEHYDSMGLWRDTENDSPIDSSGELLKTDARGKFDSAIDLIERMAGSEDAQSCYIRHWMKFAYGRDEAPEDACTRSALQAAFRASDGNVLELLVAVAKTDHFRYRLESL